MARIPEGYHQLRNIFGRYTSLIAKDKPKPKIPERKNTDMSINAFLVALIGFVIALSIVEHIRTYDGGDVCMTDKRGDCFLTEAR